MKIGIYLSGLGESEAESPVELYARRFARQFDSNYEDASPDFEVTADKFEYDKRNQLNCRRIVVSETKDGAAKIIYKFYEYRYAEIMTRNFKRSNALIKSGLLFLGVVSKIPLMCYRLVVTRKEVGYQPRFRAQALYMFLLFLLLSAAILFLLPAAIGVISSLLNADQWLENMVGALGLNFESVIKFSGWVTSMTAALLLLKPGFSDSLISLACEFVSASEYLERGKTKQTIHGQMDMLIEQIIKQEGEATELYFHSYSFGTLVSLDFVFPQGAEPSVRVKQHVKGLVTIGSPIDFVKVYFPKFFNELKTTLKEQLKWINVYSLADALASNFRKTDDEGPAEYSIDVHATMPINVLYEVASVDSNIFTQFFTLHSIRAHANYWDKGDDGQTCFRVLVPEMVRQGFV